MKVTRAAVVAGGLAFTLLLMATYAETSGTIYGPAFRFKEVPLGFTLLGIAMAVLPSLWMPVEVKRPSQVCYWFLYLMAILPAMWMPYQVLRVSPDQIWPFTSTLLLAFGLASLPYGWRELTMSRVKVEPVFYYGAMVAVALGLVGLIVALTGLKFDLSLANVYDRRAEARSSAPKQSLASYASGFLGNSIGPMMFATSIVNRSLVLFGTSLLALITVFSLTGLKSVFFTPFLMLAVLWLVRKKRDTFGLVLIWGAVGLAALAYFERKVFGSMLLTLAFVHRLEFTPGMLSSFYWDFFSHNPHVYLADSILSPFMHSPYDRNVGPLMGKVLYASDSMNATTGIWAQGYAHFGYLGMIYVSAFLAGLFSLFDAATRDRNFVVGSMVMALLGVFWANVALHTSLISNGVVLSLLLLYLMPIAKREPDR